MGLTLDPLLDDIPGWQEAAATELSGGLTNRTWLLDKGDARAVLKVDAAPRHAPYNPRLLEAATQSMAAEHGLAPAVLQAGESMLMTEFVDGEVWQSETFARADNIEQLAVALRRLHALPLTGRTFDSRVAAGRYLEHIDDSNAEFAARCRQVIEAQPLPHNLCVCHNDLVAANIVSAGSIMFLDWEYACDNDPFFDLATIVEHHGLGEDLAMRLLDAYFDGDGRRWLQQLESQRLLYAALCWLWLASRPDTAAEQLERVAARVRR